MMADSMTVMMLMMMLQNKCQISIYIEHLMKHCLALARWAVIRFFLLSFCLKAVTTFLASIFVFNFFLFLSNKLEIQKKEAITIIINVLQLFVYAHTHQHKQTQKPDVNNFFFFFRIVWAVLLGECKINWLNCIHYTQCVLQSI